MPPNKTGSVWDLRWSSVWSQQLKRPTQVPRKCVFNFHKKWRGVCSHHPCLLYRRRSMLGIFSKHQRSCRGCTRSLKRFNHPWPFLGKKGSPRQVLFGKCFNIQVQRSDIADCFSTLWRAPSEQKRGKTYPDGPWRVVQ